MQLKCVTMTDIKIHPKFKKKTVNRINITSPFLISR